jgi:hypothetical protein
MPISYGPSVPVDDIPADLLAATEATDEMLGDELAALIPPFESPIGPKVMNALAKAVADAAKVMGMDIVPEKYTAPTTEFEPDLVRFLTMLGAASTDYGKPIPSPDTLVDEAGITALTAAIIELAADDGFNEFLDMPSDEAPDETFVEETVTEAPTPGGSEDFDFASRMN